MITQEEFVAFALSLLVVISFGVLFLSNAKHWLIILFVLIVGLGICASEFQPETLTEEPKPVPTFTYRDGDVEYGDQNTYKDSNNVWHLPYREAHDSLFIRIHF